MNNNSILTVLGMLALATGQKALAQQLTSPPQTEIILGSPEEIESNPLKFGSVFVIPTVAVKYGYDNNVTRKPHNRLSSQTFIVQPGLVADYETGADRYELSYGGALNRFMSSSADNTDNHDLRLRGANGLTVRQDLNWQLAWEDRYDPRGTSDRNINATQPDHFQRGRVGGTYGYGAEGAQGRIEFDAFLSNKRYQNNRDSTRTADVDVRDLAARFDYRVMPRTLLGFELRDSQFNYLASDARLDNMDRRYYIGADWEATASTSGKLRVGLQEKKYDTHARRSFTGLSWELGLSWQPLSYTRLDISTSRAATDPVAGLANVNFIRTTTHQIDWTHEWTGYLRTRLGWLAQASAYDVSSGLARKDHLNVLSLGTYYGLRRWLDLGIEFSDSRRDTNDSAYAYTQRRTMFVMEAKF